MRRVWMGQLVLLAALAILTGPARFARAADLPYEGNWRITYFEFDQAIERDLWLVKIDKDNKKAEALWANPHPDISDTKIAEFKAEADSLRITFRGTHNNEFQLHVRPSRGRPDSMLGTVRIGYTFNPIRMERTEATKLNPATAVRPMAGRSELEATFKTKSADERIKLFKEIIKTFDGKPIVLLASQLLLGELATKKAGADAIKPVADQYVKLVAPYGREMEVQVNLYLSRNMVNYDPTLALALKYAEQAVRMLKEDDNRGVRLMAFMALANAQQKNGKSDAVKETLAKINAIVEDVIKKPHFGGGPLIPTREMAAILLQSLAPAVRESGLEFARRAVKLLKDDTPTDEKMRTYRLLRGALQATGKQDEAKKVTTVVEKLEDDLDNEYLKTSLPFKPGRYAGRKGTSDRVAVVELFTNVQSPDCTAADMAFTGLVRTYTPRDAVFLEYHQHVRGIPPDPLVNLDSEARAKFYEFDLEERPPTFFVNGKPTMSLPRGDKQNAKADYDALRKQIQQSLDTHAAATIKLQVTRTGDKIDIVGDVSDLKGSPAKAKLRFVLVEDTVRYVGINGVRLHHHVVRALPGGAAGFGLDKKATSHKATVNVGELRKKLMLYNTGIAARAAFPNPEIQIKLGNLKVIALVQDEDNKKILQAAQADVPEGKKE